MASVTFRITGSPQVALANMQLLDLDHSKLGFNEGFGRFDVMEISYIDFSLVIAIGESAV